MNRGELHAFGAGLQLMAIISGASINILGYIVDADYFWASIPFFLVSVLSPIVISWRLHDWKIAEANNPEVETEDA